MIRYLFKRDTLLATLLVFVLIGLLALIPVNTHFLDPIKLALQDFDYNDLAYSQLHKNETTSIDTNIIIVNIGKSDRNEIAGMIEKVQERKPRVLGVDVFFKDPKTPEEDSALVAVLPKHKNLVLAYELREINHHIGPAGFLRTQAASSGYVNFVGEEGGVNRAVAPFIKQENSSYCAFSSEVIRLADPAAYQTLVERGKKAETINYMRRNDQFHIIEGADILAESDSTVMENKIVLLGYTSEDPNDVEDKKFTPMNYKSFGKSLPDMAGVNIHANIINMVLQGKYINKMPTWLTWGLAFVICWFHMAIFLAYAIERHLWFHLLAKIAQVLSAVLFILIGLYIYMKFDYKINLVPSFVAIILAVDVLYFYEAICNWMHHRYRLPSVFHNPNSKHKHK
jgi:CHASE2 domain-containing sensor protein